TRVYLADHWPSDVAGGLLLGAAVAWAVRVDRPRRSS
ncbi:MAG TPA: phosphatase PAP2 family protein, partial [Candidatus Limnocylindria bacterium]